MAMPEGRARSRRGASSRSGHLCQASAGRCRRAPWRLRGGQRRADRAGQGARDRSQRPHHVTHILLDEGDTCGARTRSRFRSAPRKALDRVEQSLRSFPGDFWTQVHAGDVHLALSDLEGAERAFRAALVMARARGDADAIADANERLVHVFAEAAGVRAGGAAGRRARCAARPRPRRWGHGSW